ncbi:RsmE family RNA methyltransferase [Chitinispirillales bacterium ANBcel5]|uniref:16S rRNA (uracil(1498)-N(3))-methyltransferase n=1 Tax=Cellulosispirillum alkaliphilum TaxID=3039283 RepID=UPI002A4FEA23|nr:RsmE family RNA methyltransferase [Chitinispirillales bacterium ANBcel5]
MKKKHNDHFLFYSESKTKNRITINGQEKQHAIAVLRVEDGEHIQITDGQGNLFVCEVESVLKSSIECNIVESWSVKRITPDVTIALGLTDRAHFESAIESLTALGVKKIIPVIFEHCRKPWWDKWRRYEERFKLKMISSMKQCLYPYIPELVYPTILKEVLEEDKTHMIVADPNGSTLKSEIRDKQTPVTCIIGPPGGFSATEISEFNRTKVVYVKLTPNRLRTELAATVLCAQIIGHTL